MISAADCWIAKRTNGASSSFPWKRCPAIHCGANLVRGYGPSGSADMVETAKRGPRAWNALYQQRPVVEEGDYFKSSTGHSWTPTHTR